jgi:hypothetical protein
MNKNKPINNKWIINKENINPYDKNYIQDKIIIIFFYNIYYPITHE